MLDPRYIDDLPASIVALYRQAEDAILQDMARKLGAYDYWMPAVEWQNQKLRQAGELQETIISELAKISKKSEDELRRLMSDAGSLALKLDAEVYDNAGLQVPDFNMAEPLRKVLNAGYQQTAGTMRNLTRSTATAAQQQFFDAADLAWAKIQSGAIDYTTAIREAIKTLADKGIASISYPGGYTDYMDVAVRRAVVTGVNQTACKLSEELADELECDLVEVSAHSGARPSHAEWQGKIYSRSGKSEKYPDFRTSTGYGTGAGLGGWNCRHSFGPYVEGSPRIWSDAELEKLNAKDYEYNGEKLTEYEATQQQRYFERQIRKAKREEIALEAAGQDASEAKSRVAYYQKKQADFLDQTGLKRQYERENVYGKALKSAPKSATIKSNRDYDSELAKKFGKAHYDSMRDLVDKAENRTAAKVWDKYEKEIIVGDAQYAGHAHASGSAIYVNVAAVAKGNSFSAPFQTLFHECGHAIDSAARSQIKASYFSQHYSSAYKNGIFPQTIKDEVAALVDERAKKIKADFKAHAGDMEWFWKNGYISDQYRKQFAYKALEKEIVAIGNMRVYCDISDILEGATGAKIQCGIGHGAKYWKDRTFGGLADGLATEAFAEMCDSTFANPESVELIKKYLPKSYALFNEMLDSLL